MNRGDRNMLLLFNYEFKTAHSLEQEVECLQQILFNIVSPYHFCRAHELVDRNRITTKRSRLLKESRYQHLRAFRFLINRN